MTLTKYDIPFEELGPVTPFSSRYHPMMGSPIILKDGSSANVLEIAQRVYDNEFFGKALEEQELRFAQRYGYDRERMLADLGADLHPVGHQYELGWHTAKVIEYDKDLLNLTEQQVATVMLASLVHDMGETMHRHIVAVCGNVIGDIAAGLKTDTDRETEARIRNYMYRTLLKDLPLSTLSEIEGIISHQDTGILHEIYEVAHEAQTLETVQLAERAYEASPYWHDPAHDAVLELTPIEEGRRIRCLLGIAKHVLNHHYDRFEGHADWSQYMATLLNQADAEVAA